MPLSGKGMLITMMDADPAEERDFNKWYDKATMQQRMEAFRSLFEMAKRGLLKTKVEKAYPLSEFKAAVAHAAQGKRSGKVIFEFAP